MCFKWIRSDFFQLCAFWHAFGTVFVILRSMVVDYICFTRLGTSFLDFDSACNSFEVVHQSLQAPRYVPLRFLALSWWGPEAKPLDGKDLERNSALDRCIKSSPSLFWGLFMNKNVLCFIISSGVCCVVVFLEVALSKAILRKQELRFSR